jgi:hypothetical protein
MTLLYHIHHYSHEYTVYVCHKIIRLRICLKYGVGSGEWLVRGCT